MTYAGSNVQATLSCGCGAHGGGDRRRHLLARRRQPAGAASFHPEGAERPEAPLPPPAASLSPAGHQCQVVASRISSERLEVRDAAGRQSPDPPEVTPWAWCR